MSAMALEIRLFPCLSDNYGFLVRDVATGAVATVDTPDADAILAELERSSWGRLDLILNTHWHPDHTQGNAAIKTGTGCEIVGPEEVRRAAPLDRVVRGGDIVRLGETEFEVTGAPGHTLGHVVYRSAADAQAFVGDVLFVMGCGRLFEGTPEQMWASLRTLAAWPDDTVIWCAHEYTASNARFALSVDDRPEMEARAAGVLAMREHGEPTVPTTIGAEKAFNPFLRAGDAAAFAALRAAKDGFSG
jgi:hydroxyacylglutathione hydrolase